MQAETEKHWRVPQRREVRANDLVAEYLPTGTCTSLLDVEVELTAQRPMKRLASSGLGRVVVVVVVERRELVEEVRPLAARVCA